MNLHTSNIMCKIIHFIPNQQIIEPKTVRNKLKLYLFSKNIANYLHISEKVSTFALAFEKYLKRLHRGVEQLVARQAHNLEVACSSLASATTYNQSE